MQLITLSILFIQQVSSRIKKNGIWTGNDWYDPDVKIGVFNGMLWGDDTPTTERMTDAWLIEPQGQLGQQGVERVKQILTEDDWDYLFPIRNEKYDYYNFIYAVAVYPQFCFGYAWNEDQDRWCKIELATLLAHMIEDTNQHNNDEVENWRRGLFHLFDPSCDEDLPNNERNNCANTSNCNSCPFPPTHGEQYYGRGAMKLTGNTNYGPFSKAYENWEWEGEQLLLDSPEAVAQDGKIALTSALWLYMTPRDTNPSPHDVVIHRWQPNDVDREAGITHGFGTTINILYSWRECQNGSGHESEQASRRIENYTQLLNYFELDPDDNLGCDSQRSLPYGGAGNQPRYFAKDWFSNTNSPKCKVVDYATEYTIYDIDDYKRCVCKEWGQGELSCQQEQAKCALWSDGAVIHDSNVKEIIMDDLPLEIETWDLVTEILELPSCFDDQGNLVVEQYPQVFFYFLELVMDNFNRTSEDPEFQALYEMQIDSYLNVQIDNTFTANPLEQESIILRDDFSSQLTITNEINVRGAWQFRVKACEYLNPVIGYVCNDGQTLILDIQVENSPPYFAQGDEFKLTFKENSGVQTWQMFDPIDDEGDRVDVRIGEIFSYDFIEVQHIANEELSEEKWIVEFTINQSVSVDEYFIDIFLADSQDQSYFILTVEIVENNAPFFDLPNAISFKENSGVQFFTLPAPIDDENDLIEVSFDFEGLDFVTSQQSQQDEIGFDRIWVLVFNLDQSVQPDEYQIAITLSDGVLETFYKLAVEIVSNSAPYFESNEIYTSYGSFKQNSGQNVYEFSQLVDDEGDHVNMSVDLLNAASFAQWQPDNHRIVFELDNTVDLNVYMINVILSDGVADNSYELTVEILDNTAPYFFNNVETTTFKWKSGENVLYLPDTRDDEGDHVIIEVDTGDTESFAYFNANEIHFMLDEAVDIGTYFYSITLSDGIASNTYEAYLEVEENTPPYFEFPIAPMVFREDSGEHMVQLPDTVDEEGDIVVIEVMLLFTQPFATWEPENKRIIFSLDSSVSVGEYDFMIKLSDGFENSFYPQTVSVILNTRPYFETDINPTVWSENSGEHILQLPVALDDQSDSVTISVDLAEVEDFAILIPFASIVFTLNDNVSPGSYKLIITLSDGLANRLYEVVVEVYQNGAPYFTEWGNRLELTENTGEFIYDFVQTKDDENDEIKVESDISSIEAFAQYYEDLVRPYIVFNLDQNNIVGSYEVFIQLEDPYGNFNLYTLNVEVIEDDQESTDETSTNRAPYFDQDEWVNSMPVQLTYIPNGLGTVVVYTFPTPIDLDGDEVIISVNMDKFKDFAVFDPLGSITFTLTEPIEEGLHFTPVTLNDGQTTSEYQLYIYVNPLPTESDGQNIDQQDDSGTDENNRDENNSDEYEDNGGIDDESNEEYEEQDELTNEERETIRQQEIKENTKLLVERLARLIRERVDQNAELIAQGIAITGELQDDPKMSITRFTENGELFFEFNQDFEVPTEIQELDFATSEHSLEQESSLEQRNLKEMSNEVDLSEFMDFQLIRGDNDSSSSDDYKFSVRIKQFTERELVLGFMFTKPLMISSGEEPDILHTTIVLPDMFSSKATGKTVQGGTRFEVPIPRQYPSGAEWIVVTATSTAVSAATQTAGLSQLLITIPLALSMKSFWFLMNMMQVIAYLRHIENLPANVETVLQSLNNAVTFKFFFKVGHEYWQSRNGEERDEDLADVGIEETNLFWSFGPYAKLFVGLFFTFSFYFLGKVIVARVCPALQVIQIILGKNLVFSSIIRFFIEANLKITHNTIFFLYLKGSFDSTSLIGWTIFNIFMLTTILIWPVFLAGFLLYTRDVQEEEDFAIKYHSTFLFKKRNNYLGNGFKEDKSGCVLYSVWFCLRRLCLVVCFFLTRTYMTQTEYIYGILFIQVWYLMYIYDYLPHTMDWFNRLEIINELLFCLIVYTLTGFLPSDITDFLTVQQQWTLGYVTIGIIFIIYSINFAYMAVTTTSKLQRLMKKWKYKKAVKNMQKARLDKLNDGMEEDYGRIETCASDRKITMMSLGEEDSIVSMSRFDKQDDDEALRIPEQEDDSPKLIQIPRDESPAVRIRMQRKNYANQSCNTPSHLSNKIKSSQDSSTPSSLGSKQTGSSSAAFFSEYKQTDVNNFSQELSSIQEIREAAGEIEESMYSNRKAFESNRGLIEEENPQNNTESRVDVQRRQSDRQQHDPWEVTLEISDISIPTDCLAEVNISGSQSEMERASPMSSHLNTQERQSTLIETMRQTQDDKMFETKHRLDSPVMPQPQPVPPDILSDDVEDTVSKLSKCKQSNQPQEFDSFDMEEIKQMGELTRQHIERDKQIDHWQDNTSQTDSDGIDVSAQKIPRKLTLLQANEKDNLQPELEQSKTQKRNTITAKKYNSKQQTYK